MRHFGLFLLSLTQGLDNYLTQGVDNKQEVFSVDDEGIPSANRELKYQDGDIRREFEDAPGRSTINDEFYRWKLPIPVALSHEMGIKARGEYNQAKIEYQLRTCVDFKEWEGEEDFISIYPMSGCWSYVGQVFPNQQNVSIQQPGCDWSGTIQHELMHALGIYHEQSRPDRDDYVFIDMEAVTEGYQNNFYKYDFNYVSPVGTEYAYDSIMHYGPYSFNKDPDVPTILPRIKYFLPVIGQSKTFSTLDATRINRIYDCSKPLHKTFNCNFNELNICGFVNEDENDNNWSQYDVQSQKDLWSIQKRLTTRAHPPTDASQAVTDPGRYVYIDGGSGALITRVFTHEHPDQCLVVWTFMTSGRISVEFYSTTEDYGEKLEIQDSFEIYVQPGNEGKWQYNQYNYKPQQSKFKVRIHYVGTELAAIDDISIQEATCRDNTFTITNYSVRLQAALDAIAAKPEISISDIPENNYWSPVMYDPTGHSFQIRFMFQSALRKDDGTLRYPGYSGSYLFLTSDANNDDVFWPWNDQFYKMFVRDRNPNVLERMDFHYSYVTGVEETPVWVKPADGEMSGGYGSGRFITHFDVLTNQQGYYSKDDEIYVQGKVY